MVGLPTSGKFLGVNYVQEYSFNKFNISIFL
jgi:hypothetical protein